ncbi:MAG: 3-hydroxylacyl-ACP dehydratase [Halieaceae bacterium]|nr:3-hydroxylacyl-ACP dehydratase [Halieaceae bacterium]
MPESIPIEQLLSHAKPMLLLDSLLHSGQDYIVCGLQVRADGLFNTNDRVPALMGIEYMAQTIAAFAGLKAIERGGEPKMGFLLGTRKFTSNVAEFPCKILLSVKAHRAVQGSDGMAAFECTVEGESVRQTATLTVYEPSNPEQFLIGANE